MNCNTTHYRANSSSVPGDPTLDGRLIKSAQGALGTSVADWAYAIIRQKALSAENAPWSASTVIGSGDTKAFANGEAVRQAEIPYFFTREGYEKYYQTGLQSIEYDLKRDSWVFGDDAKTMAIREQLSRVRPGVAKAYSDEYIAYWNKLVGMLQPADYFGDSGALAALTRSPSPLKLLLLEVRHNTRFDGGSRAATDLVKQRVKTRVGAAATLVPSSTSLDAGQTIEYAFKSLHDYVGDGKSAAPIDAFLKALRDEVDAVTEARLAGGGMGSEVAQAKMNAATVQVQRAAGDAPDMLQGFVGKVKQGGSQEQTTAATGAVADAFARTVLPSCRQASHERFPFFSGAEEDVSIVDAQRVFGLGELIDSFVQLRLVPLLDRDGPVWRWKQDNPVAAMLDPASPDSFAKAAQVRNLLTEGVTITLDVVRFEGGIDAARFASGDTSHLFSAASPAAKQLRWSAQGGAPSASVTLMRGGQEVGRIEATGAWALFRLIERARRENKGPRTFLATFSSAGAAATFRINLPNEHNPFGRGGMWSFRCPLRL